MVGEVLTDWEWCSADYGSWDFQHPDGLRLDVKQTALRQSWKSEKAPQPAWDIAPRKGYWRDGAEWVAEEGRNAEIYVFALHAVEDDSADHRRPDQWRFYVVAEQSLPGIQRLNLSKALELTAPVRIEDLAVAVRAVARLISPPKQAVAS